MVVFIVAPEIAKLSGLPQRPGTRKVQLGVHGVSPIRGESVNDKRHGFGSRGATALIVKDETAARVTIIIAIPITLKRCRQARPRHHRVGGRR